ncbi:calcium-activated chloride channel regulator 4A [Trichonephila inaurata madagascariensis]|uniref:Calcium-activated chloride channel regulator 4A n=1 Tax=Trichonephila inaurata madagascariensis TaxID=2747483 RepID=A0A8X6Y2F9_9ARAC|nr:calcium-activated chloride channel regulator 4A [Trichonephila inaurata madagascariensis]
MNQNTKTSDAGRWRLFYDVVDLFGDFPDRREADTFSFTLTSRTSLPAVEGSRGKEAYRFLHADCFNSMRFTISTMELSKISSFFLLLFFLCVSPNSSVASVISLDGNGYSGIVVAIHKNVPEDLEILNNIKTLFSKASTFLYNSTKDTLFFKEVTIVVPPTWSTHPDFEILPGNFFSNAHVRVDLANPEYNNTPYTLQPGGCGEHGHYIHLTPWFLKELNGKTVEMYGAPGKIRPTSCVRDIKGWIESRDGGPCTMTQSGEVDSDCIFIPNMHHNEAKASIMYMPFIPSMEGFCDDGSHRHNVLAPTKHNAICNYRSTWDVISQHNDFHKLRSKRDALTELTETLFRVVQSPKDPTSRYVLVLDVSGSMNGQPMKLLHSAAVRLVEDRIPDGAFLGLVQFSTDASILRNLTKVDNTTRYQLSKSLPAKDDGGRTAIGKGLQKAIEVLTNDNSTAEGGLIMLITDGEENVLPFIEDVLPEVLEYNVIINAVAFGSEASAKLEHMTAVTGGRGYFFSNNGSRPASALDSAFLESITSQADIELQPVQLKDEMFTLDQVILTKHVYIDEELGKDTSFTITSRHIERVGDVVLRSPSGALYDSTKPQYSRDDTLRQRIQITLPESEPGKWEVIIRRRGDYPVAVGFAVTSEPKDVRDQPVRVRSWLSADVTENDGIYTGYFTHFNGNGRYAVIARVSNDGQAKLKQGSIASASQPMPLMKGKTTDVPVNEFEPEDFELSTKNETETDDDFDTEPANKFDRSSNTGAFRLESWSSDVGDIIPPGDITDLKVVSIVEAGNKRIINMEFTTPGDDFDVGNVTSLELRASENKEELVANFESGHLLNETHIVNGSLQPLGPGEKATITVELPEIFSHSEPYTVYFAMKATDDAGNTSSRYNIASHTFGFRFKVLRQIKGSKTTAHEDDVKNVEDVKVHGEKIPPQDNNSKDDISKSMMTNDDNTDEAGKNSKWWPVIVGIGVAFTVIMIAVLIAVVIIKKSKQRTYSSVQNQQC